MANHASLRFSTNEIHCNLICYYSGSLLKFGKYVFYFFFPYKIALFLLKRKFYYKFIYTVSYIIKCQTKKYANDGEFI